MKRPIALCPLLVVCCEGPSPATDASFVEDGPAYPQGDPCQRESPGDDTDACGRGGGAFGRWIAGPAYEYTSDQARLREAAWTDSRGTDRRDHWHQLGNDRVLATASNDGVIQLLGQERGATWYNRLDPDGDNHGGGWSYLREGASVWATAYALRPEGARTRRVFGLGYVESMTEHQGLRVVRRTRAPEGDYPGLVTDIEVTNLRGVPRSIEHYEYWDVNRHQLVFQPVRTAGFGANGDRARDALNARFTQSVRWDASSQVLRSTMTHLPMDNTPPEDAIAAEDHYPRDVFLASLVGRVSEVYTDQARFFGRGPLARPPGAVELRAGELLTNAPARGQPACLVQRTDLRLGPFERARLRVLYGYVRVGADPEIPARWRGPEVEESAQDAGFTLLGRSAYLRREGRWHSYYLRSASAWVDYYQTHVIAQGGAYLFSHGFDGAPRDQALFSMPLSWIDPARARELLTFVMEMTRAETGAIAYSYHGHGVLENAQIHTAPSDLDLYLLLGLAEYLSVTGDRAFLEARVPFHPRGAAPPASAGGDRVLDHARLAFRHLVDTVGLGEHGLVRVGTGDWNDGITLVYGPAGRERTVPVGESHANTAMGAFVLPLAAAALESSDGALAAAMRAYGERLRDALRRSWSGRWYPRAWLRDETNAPRLVGADDGFLWLETQPWALLADAPDREGREALLGAITSRLDDPSPIGAMIQEPVPGNEEIAQVWPAVTGILTWAYARGRPDLAWRAVERNSLFARAEAYPAVWSGIWSGPDGVHGARAQRPGLPWSSVATPMIDFPVMNSNLHAMALLGMLRAVGVEPSGDGLRVRVSPSSGPAGFETRLWRVEARRDGARTRVVVHGRRTLRGPVAVTVVVPEGYRLAEDTSPCSDFGEAVGAAEVSPDGATARLRFSPGTAPETLGPREGWAVGCVTLAMR